MLLLFFVDSDLLLLIFKQGQEVIVLFGPGIKLTQSLSELVFAFVPLFFDCRCPLLQISLPHLRLSEIFLEKLEFPVLRLHGFVLRFAQNLHLLRQQFDLLLVFVASKLKADCLFAI